MWTRAALIALGLTGPALAQQPLSAIDWLNEPPRNLPGTVLLEPPVTDTGALVSTSVTHFRLRTALRFLASARLS